MKLDATDPLRLTLAMLAPLALLLGFALWAERGVAPGLLPHGFCFSWVPSLLWLHVASDFLIGLAYLTIPFTIFYFVRRRGDLPFNWIFVLFALFIVACGSTHFMSIWNVWHPDYWVSGAIKALTAAVSVPTGWALVGLVPRALALPTTEQLRATKDALEQEVAMRRAIEAQLRESQAVLERRVAERTRELAEANALLDTVFNSAPVGLGLWDHDTRFVRLNDALVNINGIAREQQLGRPLAEVLPDIDPEVDAALRKVARTGVPVIRLQATGRTPASPRTRIWEVSLYPVRVGGEQVAVGGICEEVTDKHEAERERARLLAQAQEAHAEAEAANRRKDEFLAKVSHELRTPLQAMLGWVQMLKSGRLGAADAARALERLDHNVRAQARLIDDLLDYSRILSGKLRLDLAPIDAAVPIRAAIEVVRQAAQAKGIEIEADLDTGGAALWLDADRIQQVIWNLLTNAVKFSPHGARIGLQARQRDGRLRIRVQDAGRGIEPALLPHLFEPFRQGESDPSAAALGLGLGLSIAHSIVELHGGTIEAQSAGLGQGATFTVELAPHEARAAAEGGLPPAAPDSIEALRLLLVEDETDAAESVAMGLRLLGARVEVAHDAEAALGRLRAATFDALVSDLRLGSGPSGHALIEAVRAGQAGSANAAVAAVAVSAFGTEQDQRRSLQAGFAAHLTKPVDAAAIARAVAHAVRGRA